VGANEQSIQPAGQGCKMMVIGAAAIDITSRVPPDDPSNPLATRSTSPGSVKMSLGGVALNIARASHGLGIKDVMLVSQLGRDCSFGDYLLNQLRAIGLRSDGIHLNHRASTGIVNMFLDRNGDLLGGVADLKSIENLDCELVRYNFYIFQEEQVDTKRECSLSSISSLLQNRFLS
jgi:pseudouridine-5'-phosphate glycosidase/pseudouridine kinase